MYNLNVNLAATAAANPIANLLSAENACTTPRTPEILNSVMAMTNPLDNYTFGEDAPKKQANAPITSMSSDSNSSSCSQLESPTNAPPSVQHTCSQLIRAGLKLTIEQKRKIHSDSEDILDLDKCKRIKKNESESEEDKHHTGGVRFIIISLLFLSISQSLLVHPSFASGLKSSEHILAKTQNCAS